MWLINVFQHLHPLKLHWLGSAYSRPVGHKATASTTSSLDAATQTSTCSLTCMGQSPSLDLQPPGPKKAGNNCKVFAYTCLPGQCLDVLRRCSSGSSSKVLRVCCNSGPRI